MTDAQVKQAVDMYGEGVTFQVSQKGIYTPLYIRYILSNDTSTRERVEDSIGFDSAIWLAYYPVKVQIPVQIWIEAPYIYYIQIIIFPLIFHTLICWNWSLYNMYKKNMDDLDFLEKEVKRIKRKYGRHKNGLKMLNDLCLLNEEFETILKRLFKPIFG